MAAHNFIFSQVFYWLGNTRTLLCQIMNWLFCAITQPYVHVSQHLLSDVFMLFSVSLTLLQREADCCFQEQHISSLTWLSESGIQTWLLWFVMQVFDQSALSTEAKEEMYKLYPNARRAHLKTGGNFPYLCRSAEVNLYIQVSVCIQTGSAAVHSNRKRLFCTGFSPLACLSSAPRLLIQNAGMEVVTFMGDWLWGFTSCPFSLSSCTQKP